MEPGRKPKPHVFPGGQHFPGQGPQPLPRPADTAPPKQLPPLKPLTPPETPREPRRRRRWSGKRITLLIIIILVVVDLIPKGSDSPQRSGVRSGERNGGGNAEATAFVEDKLVPKLLDVPVIRVQVADERPGTFFAEYAARPRGVYLYRVAAGTGAKTLEKVYRPGSAWGRAVKAGAEGDVTGLCWRRIHKTNNLNPRDLIPVLNSATTPVFTGKTGKDTVSVRGYLSAEDQQERYTGILKVNTSNDLPVGYEFRGETGSRSRGEVTYSINVSIPAPRPKC